MELNNFENNIGYAQCNVMTNDPYLNIEAALSYVVDKGDNLTSEAERHIGRYVHSQCQQWADMMDKRWNCEDVVYGLIRANVIVQREENKGIDKTVPMRQGVEQRARIPMVHYGVREEDEGVTRRVSLLTGMLFNEENQPLYEKQGLFLANLINGIMIDNSSNCNQKISEVAKIFLDSIFRLPDEARKNVVQIFSVGCWTKELKDYLAEKQAHIHHNGEMPRNIDVVKRGQKGLTR